MYLKYAKIEVLLLKFNRALLVSNTAIIIWVRYSQEWTKQNLWKTAFKKFELIWSAWAEHITSKFLKAVFHIFLLIHSRILCPIYCAMWWVINSIKHSRMNQVKFFRPYHFIFLKGCLPQILLGPFLNTLTHM